MLSKRSRKKKIKMTGTAPKLQSPDDIELEGYRGKRWRRAHQSVKSNDTKDEAEKGAGQNSSQDGAARTAH